MLIAENQVIERNIEHLPAGNVLLVDMANDNALSHFAQLRNDIAWFGYTPYADTFSALNSDSVSFSAWYDSEQTFDAVVIYYPKTKLRFDYYLSMVSKHLKADATIYVVGEKKGGIGSASKTMANYCYKPHKLDSARHCVMFWGAFNQHVCNKTVDDWYSVTEFNMAIAGQNLSLSLYALPGVFSAERVDEGTELLLQSIDQLSAKALDFGCGCGVISAALNKRFGSEFLAIDVDALAVASANKTYQINQTQCQAISSNGLQNVPTNQKFDALVTNPPFHTGLKTDYGITEQLLSKWRLHSNAKSQIWMVANQFLPYQELFGKYLSPAVIKNKNKRFNVYYLNTSI